MNRVKKTILYFFIAAAILYLVICLSNLHFTQKGVFEANERGLHYGPSEEILAAEANPDGYGIVVGRLEDGGYSIFEMKRRYGVFWGLPEGFAVGEHQLRNEVDVVFLSRTKCILVMSKNQDIKEVYFELRIKEDEDILYEKNSTAILDDKGFAFLELYDETKMIDLSNIYDAVPAYLEGRDAEGNVIWSLSRNL